MKDPVRSDPRGYRPFTIAMAMLVFGLTAQPALTQVIPTYVQWFEAGDQENWTVASAGGAKVDGDKSKYKARHQINADGFGGIEDLQQLHYKDAGLLTLEARLLAGNNDFRALVDYTADSGWSLQGGYRQYQVWYDMSGGYISANDAFFDIFDRSGSIDRGILWVEYELTREDGIGAYLRYSHTFRNGQKGSTSWGDSDETGGVGRRAIVPSFYDIDESRDIIEGEVNYTNESTKVGLGLRYDTSDYGNRRQMRLEPGESSDRYLTHRETNETDLFSMHGYVDTQLSKNWRFSLGGIYTDLDATFGGDRIWGTGYDPIYDPGFQRQGVGFIDLQSATGMEQYIGNMNLVFTPHKNWRLLGALRMEKVDTDAMSDFIETSYSGGARFTEMEGMSESQFDEIRENIEVQYRGAKSIIVTASGEWSQGDGNLRETLVEVEDDSIDIARDTARDRTTEKYALSANWGPSTTFGVTAQAYHKIRKNEYDSSLDSTPPGSTFRYPAYIANQEFTTDDINLRVTWRPDPKIKLVARVDDQNTTIDSQMEELASVKSGDLKTRIYSGAVTLMPQNWLLIQGTINYTSDQLDSGQNDSVLDVAPNSTSDYWIGTLNLFLAINEDTDLQLEYTAYEADNYFDNSATTVPFGVGEKEDQFGIGITRRFSDQMMISAHYGYATYESATTGNNNDYDAHTLYGRLAYRF
jgi:hypothetical protein